MRALVPFRTLILTKLGTCAFCIRLSLVLSLSSWAVVATLSFFLPGSLAGKLAFVPAFGLTALFASHLVAYAVRVAVAYRKSGSAALSADTASTANRRRFLVLSAQAIGVALVPTVFASALWGSVRADPNCRPPSNCASLCCCNGCKTQLKPCDPSYGSCQVYCATQNWKCIGPVP